MFDLDVSVCRSKQLNQPASQAVPPTKLAAIQSQMGGSSHKEEGSSGSSPRSEGKYRCSSSHESTRVNTLHDVDSPLPPEGQIAIANGSGAARKTQTWSTGSNWPANGPSTGHVGTLSKPPPGRDPKSRARSRDYLKQYVFMLVLGSFYQSCVL